METLKLTIHPEVGKNDFQEMRDLLDQFVLENFDLLYSGAIRLGAHIEADDYAPRRVQINDTRLHESRGLKYADGHKYNEDRVISADELKNTVSDLQKLLDTIAKPLLANFTIEIKEVKMNRKNENEKYDIYDIEKAFSVRKKLVEAGRRGGLKSRRTLSSDQARAMAQKSAMKTINDSRLFNELQEVLLEDCWNCLFDDDNLKNDDIPAFAGGLDHVERTKTGVYFYDIGCNGKNNSFVIRRKR